MIRLNKFWLSFLCVSCLSAADPAPDLTKRQDATEFPEGMVAIFAGSSCPDGWTDEPLTQGRVAIGAPSPEESGEVVGEPFLEKRTRRHTHAYSMTGELRRGPMNTYRNSLVSWVLPQTFEFLGETVGADSGLPFYSTPMCRRSVER